MLILLGFPLCFLRGGDYDFGWFGLGFWQPIDVWSYPFIVDEVIFLLFLTLLVPCAGV